MAQHRLTPHDVQSCSPAPGPFAGVGAGNISPTGAALSPVPGPIGGVCGDIISPTGAAFALSVPVPFCQSRHRDVNAREVNHSRNKLDTLLYITTQCDVLALIRRGKTSQPRPAQ